ncbi:hypothetical protein [Paracoccus sulfuroxidans]|uniref:hypothetical protein n=1 Tax=Paracoccus sulfuroxidans TaxID=384678 RepID=UPI000FDFA0FC|nr:hypothetical protein [Paracoccus sulfuroxidans]AZV00344.1 hypothetical protein psul1_p36 [Paracoccus phage vB_PsuS_Psul1]
MALESQRRLDDLAIVSAWIGAGLQRAKRLPKLDSLIRRPGRRAKTTAQDLQMYLGQMRAALPSISMEEWRARHARR